MHSLGQYVIQPGVADQEARCVIEPRLRVEIETLQTGETWIGNRLALPEKRRLEWLHGEHVFDDSGVVEKGDALENSGVRPEYGLANLRFLVAPSLATVAPS